jgi:tRNA A37 threonylcarbamoyladenosine dehydratase
MNNTPKQIDSERRFGGIKRLYGSEGWQSIQQGRVLVAGLGGVGSWVVEALARSGVGGLTLLDFDHVSLSNINRQLPALTSTLGKAKSVILAERVRDINPYAEIQIVDTWLTPEEVHTQVEASYDVVVDAIDDSRAKAALIALCAGRSQPLIVCGGAGGRRHPSMIQAAPLEEVCGDRLLARVRALLRRDHRARGLKVTCLFSQEKIINSPHSRSLGGGTALACSGYGASMMMTATMGMHASAWVLEHLIKNT